MFLSMTIVAIDSSVSGRGSAVVATVPLSTVDLWCNVAVLGAAADRSTTVCCTHRCVEQGTILRRTFASPQVPCSVVV